MIYMSQLASDEKIRKIISDTGMGLECIEFSVSENLDNLKSSLSNFKKRLEYMDVRALTMHGPFLDLNPSSYDSRIRDITMLRFEQAYEAAYELGAERITFHSGFLPRVHYKEDWAKRTADFLNAFTEGKKDIAVCLENVYDTDPYLLVCVKKLVRAENFSLCLDIGHAHCSSDVPLYDWIKILAPYTGHIHVHDNNRQWDYHMQLGKGTIPADVLPLLKSMVPEASAVIECSSEEAVRGSYEILKEYGY